MPKKKTRGLNCDPQKGSALIPVFLIILLVGVLASLLILAASITPRASQVAKNGYNTSGGQAIGNVASLTAVATPIDQAKVADAEAIKRALTLYYEEYKTYPASLSTLTKPDKNNQPLLTQLPDNTMTYKSVGASDYQLAFSLSAPTPSATLGTVPAGPVVLTSQGKDWACGDNLVDTRDNQTYKTVYIGHDCWTAQNMNYGVRKSVCNGGDCSDINGDNHRCFNYCEQNKKGDNVRYLTVAGEKYCLNDSDANCTTYGGFYTQTASTVVCPTGWHLPSLAEWNSLETFYKNSGTNCDVGRVNAWDCEGAGAQLKNPAGFGAIMTGYIEDGRKEGSGSYTKSPLSETIATAHAYFWSSTKHSYDDTGRGVLKTNYFVWGVTNESNDKYWGNASNRTFMGPIFGLDAYSVRCVRD